MLKPTLFSIVDEQADFIVIDKFPDCNFHDEGDINTGLFNQVKSQLKLPTLYPVHRLDKLTSGLIIMAKNQATAQRFQHMFEQHAIEKYYLALSDNKPKKKQGLIKGDMAKSRRGMWKLLRTTKKPAITQFFSYHLKSGLRLFLLKPHSGKTHQIRVALASIGAPIFGDGLYHKHIDNKPADRGYLHAYALRFHLAEQAYEYCLLPSRGEHFTAAEYPSEINQPWSLPWPKL